MPGKFCPKCGEEDTDLYKGLCLECYKEENSFIEAPEEIQVTRCRECGYWRYRGKWKKPSKKLMEKIVKQKLDINLERYDLTMDIDEDKVKVHIDGDIDTQGLMSLEEDREIGIEYEEKLCPVCLKRNRKDYRMKIQLRKKEEDHDPKKYEDIIQYIYSTTSKEAERDNRALAFWETDKKEGRDFYFGYSEIGKRILNKAINEFNVKAEKSTSKAGYDEEGQEKVRVTQCIRV